MLDQAENSSPGTAAARQPLLAELHGGALRLTPAGAWTVENFAVLHAAIEKVKATARKGNLRQAAIRLSVVEDLDTAGAWLLHHLRTGLADAGVEVHFTDISEKQRILLSVVDENIVRDKPARLRRRFSIPLVGDAFVALVRAVDDLVRLTGFLGQATASAGRVALRPWRFRWIAFAHHIEHTGLRAVPIIALICLLIGAVIIQQGVIQLANFGAEPFAIDMLGILALREVGVLLTAIMVAGRSASAFTAEIGSMKMREEIDAMRTIGIDPIETLVLPRIAALMVSLPILVFIGDLMCLLGGALMSMLYLDIGMEVYLARLHDAINMRHFLVGLLKAPFIALIIGLVGCLEGMSVKGSAESLGAHVTTSVVKAIFLVIVFDALFAIYLTASGY
jgi:phospholipid/cholesterol/gamma-HCH transport system permease protein